MRQGLHNAADYAMEFRTLAAGTRWSEPALVDAFVYGLKADLQAELSCKPEASSLNEAAHLAITYDRLLLERRRQLHRGLPQREINSPMGPVDNPAEPMQLGVAGMRGKFPSKCYSAGARRRTRGSGVHNPCHSPRAAPRDRRGPCGVGFLLPPYLPLIR
ncbi:hypothetical protein P4O66_000170 [Electrophorus voltai]|uniref:Retrotransposon gag domain-containing protein n=1 Tax=Electrophorus voltai TaxID=2609070 RepID=A0AAD9E3X7_9TELE|nr:hypothetical protein P4O66_000170 [Electrophorus voltai]